MDTKPAFGVHNSAFRVPHLEEAVPSSFTTEDLLAARLRVAKVVPYQRSSTPFISNLSLAIFSGLLLVFAFPDWNLWSLGWVATAPLIMAVVREQRFWRSLLLGYVTGTLFYVGSSYWVTHSIHNYGEISLVLSYVILIIFSSALGIFTGLFAAVMGQAIKRFGGWAILAAPVVWAASEWARPEVTGMGWNALGYSQAFQPAVIQIARWGGVYIVSALLVAASTALVFALVYLERRRGIIVLTAAGVIAIASVLYGQSLRPERDDLGSVSVVIIQPYIPIQGPWDEPNFFDQMTTRHIQLSEQAIQGYIKETAADGAKPSNDSEGGGTESKTAGVDLVIWPESPMNFRYDRDAELRRRIASFTRRHSTHLLMNTWGYPDGSDADDVQFNSAMVIAPSGGRIYRYDKIALVPFGEYVPARSLIPFEIHAIAGDITPGTSFTLSDVAGARLGTTICFETTRPEIARRFRREGASTLMQLSNELWFGPSAAARQMLAEAIFRAVENNVELIRATNSGLSAQVNRYGIVRDETPMMATATRVWKAKTFDEAREDEITFYTRHGDLFAVVCAVLSLLLAAASFVPEKWKGKQQDDD